MRILQVIPALTMAFGGPVAVAKSFAKELAKKHEVTILTTSAIDHRRDFKSIPFDRSENGYRILFFPRNLKASRLSISLSMERYVSACISDFDVIHVHSWRQFQDIVVAYHASRAGVPFFIQTHGSIPRIVSLQVLKYAFDMSIGQVILRNAAGYVALNDLEARQYASLGVRREDVTIIPNGIELARYQEFPYKKGAFREKNGIGENERLITYVGRLHASKGLDFLAQAHRIAASEIEDTHLLVIGPDDGYRKSFETLVAELKMEKIVTIAGFLSMEDKIAALRDSDVFVTPTYSGFPITFLEACFAEVPIITTNDELKWIHNNVGLVTDQNYESLARGIHTVLTDYELAAKLQRNCKETIKHFDMGNIGTMLEMMYDSAVTST